MKCNDDLHGALYRDHRGKWFCLLCGEEVDYNDLELKRQKAREPKDPKPEDKNDNS